MKATLKIDSDANGNVNIQIPNFKPEDLLNTKDYILIFDDLERCSIIGYINFFVKYQFHKVILIANEK
ncbi:MAG: hypothetical protein PHT94_04980 [Candidatus Nanoarchaeia archaeon]|nr:hypothetical protein [Candidatus Nanoarchaeia archaeon]